MSPELKCLMAAKLLRFPSSKRWPVDVEVDMLVRGRLVGRSRWLRSALLAEHYCHALKLPSTKSSTSTPDRIRMSAPSTTLSVVAWEFAGLTSKPMRVLPLPSA